ncbi:hypothetical protein JXB28_02305 [Candidatus Woesearchaeota archaeon]|nr:hypothetical protein [Candidatus Woesearchaeota archaeon]
MKLSGLEKALKEGCKLHGFRSGGGLRVIRIEKENKLKGYGEHPNVEDALSHANEDFLAGGRKYSEVYGKLKPHYLTGTSSATSSLDGWLLRGRTIDAYVQKGEFVVELRGLTLVEVPGDVIERVKEISVPITWFQRGFTYETRQSKLPNGDQCYATKVLKSPKEKGGRDAWMYNMVKKGKGKSFFDALEVAFEANEIEVSG